MIVLFFWLLATFSLVGALTMFVLAIESEKPLGCAWKASFGIVLIIYAVAIFGNVS